MNLGGPSYDLIFVVMHVGHRQRPQKGQRGIKAKFVGQRRWNRFPIHMEAFSENSHVIDIYGIQRKSSLTMSFRGE